MAFEYKEWDPKDPLDVLDYEIDYSEFLTAASDTIESSEWSVSPTGLTIESNANTTTRTKVWVSGGTLGVTYRLSNTIVTNNGRILNQSAHLKIRDR